MHEKHLQANYCFLCAISTNFFRFDLATLNVVNCQASQVILDLRCGDLLDPKILFYPYASGLPTDHGTILIKFMYKTDLNMWKYVSRRIRDTFERSVNHFDKRSATGVVNSASNASEDKNNRSAPPCCWFSSQKCWKSFNGDNGTNSKRWNFDQLNCSWIGAITWVS